MVWEYIIQTILAVAIFFAICLYARRISADREFTGPAPDRVAQTSDNTTPAA